MTRCTEEVHIVLAWCKQQDTYWKVYIRGHVFLHWCLLSFFSGRWDRWQASTYRFNPDFSLRHINTDGLYITSTDHMVSMGEWSQAAPVVTKWWCIYRKRDQVYLNSGRQNTRYQPQPTEPGTTKSDPSRRKSRSMKKSRSCSIEHTHTQQTL